MPRLFTALDLPDAALDALRTFRDAQDLPIRARWTPMENHHITLRFIGDVNEGRAEVIEATLDEVRARSFSVRPLGLGVLPSRRKPRVLVARIDPTQALRDLFHAVQDTLVAADIEEEERTYRPHVTLARLQEAKPERLYAALREIEGPRLDPFPADRFLLYESTLTPDGAVHTARATYPLIAE